MLKHWRAIFGGLFFLQPAWEFIKWGLDWVGRFDLITSHLHDFGVQSVLEFIKNPPPSSFLPSVVIGLLLIWWDVKRKEAAELDFDRKLLIGFFLSCAATVIAIWSMALALYYPSPTLSAPPLQKPVETPKVAPAAIPPPKPRPPWLSQEEINQQQSRGRNLLIYSPQEIFAMLTKGQNITVFGDRWVKVEGATSSLPLSEKIQDKEFYRVEFKLENEGWNYGKVAAFFDPKKYGDALLGTRLGNQLKAVCQLTKVDSKQPYSGYTITEYTFIFYNCNIL